MDAGSIHDRRAARTKIAATPSIPVFRTSRSVSMKLHYVPLLGIQRELQAMPRNFERFQTYLSTILNADRTDVELAPLLAMNPMGKDHVTKLLDELLAFDADAVGAAAVAEAAAGLDSPGDYNAALVLVDDLKGGWTNRWSYEYDLRRPTPGNKRFWVVGYLWTSEPVSPQQVRETLRSAVYRTDYVQRRGPAGTLRELLRQEGEVLARAGCISPTLEADDLAYTRQVIEPHLDAGDMRTSIECLFGDAAGKTLGFTPRGLSPWAGVALALHDACAAGLSQRESASFRAPVS
jgi:hypothetical protein